MKFPPVNEQMDLIRRGVEEILPEDELVKKIQNSYETLNPLNIKLGWIQVVLIYILGTESY